MSDHLDSYAVGSAIRLSARDVGAAIRIDTSALALALMADGLTIDGREVANHLAQTGALNALAEQLAPLIAEALSLHNGAGPMSAAVWTPDEWVRAEVDGLAPRVLNYGARDGVHLGFHFFVHDRAADQGIAASGHADTLQAAQDACDAALADLVAQRAAATAMTSEGAPDCAEPEVANG